MGTQTFCKKCVLIEHKPDIYLNDEGICNICVAYNVDKAHQAHPKILESELIKILDTFRGKAKYDCLLMASGGKDSIASLYYISKRYHLNPLVFTFDNGFEDRVALDNIQNATGILGVDWFYFHSSYMKEMYAETINDKEDFSVCMLCSLWYMQLVYQAASQYNLKLIIGGWTSGQLNVEEKEMRALTQDIPGFIDLMRKKYGKYKIFPRNMKELNKMYKISKKVKILSPHWFLPFTSEEYVETIKAQLNWRPVKLSYPKKSSNCAVNFVNSYALTKSLGFTHFHVEMSKLIRCGKLSRDEALHSLEANMKDADSVAFAKDALSDLGCDKKDWLSRCGQ